MQVLTIYLTHSTLSCSDTVILLKDLSAILPQVWESSIPCRTQWFLPPTPMSLQNTGAGRRNHSAQKGTRHLTTVMSLICVMHTVPKQEGAHSACYFWGIDKGHGLGRCTWGTCLVPRVLTLLPLSHFSAACGWPKCCYGGGIHIYCLQTGESGPKQGSECHAVHLQHHLPNTFLPVEVAEGTDSHVHGGVNYWLSLYVTINNWLVK